MKPTVVLALSWILLAADAPVHAQQFQNLDFEQAMPVLTGDLEDDRYQDPSDVLPNWIVATSVSGPGEFYGISYNSYGHIGDWPPLIHVFGGDGESTDTPGHHFRAVAGNYSAMLDPRGTWTSLQQTGLIPAGARSLRFSGKVDDEPFPPAFYFPRVEVSLNGVALPIYELGPVVGDTYQTGLYGIGQVFQYGVNLPPALAGTTATLKFYAVRDNARLTLDDIQFSPVAIPEPTTAVILGLAGLGLVAFARSQRRC